MADDNSQAAAPIDLSAGLVPKTGALGKPAAAPGSASAPTIDLSAGLVEKPEPAAPPTLGDRAAHVRDATISWLTRPKATSDKVISDLGIPEFYALRTGVGSVASMVMHPWDTAKSMATQMAEAPTALAMAIIPEKWIDQARAQGYDLSRIDKARKDTAEQLKAMGHEIKTDPERFAGEQIVQALFFHALGEGGAALKSGVADAARGVATRAGKAVLGTAPVDTAETVRGIAEDNAKAITDAAAKNADIDEKNRAAAEKHAQNLADIKAENEAKAQRVADLNAKRLATHLKKIDKVQADNADLEQAARDRTEQAQQKVSDAHADAMQAASEAADADTKRGQLAQQEIKTRQRIMERVQKNYAATRARIDASFDDVRRKVNNMDAKDAAAQEMFPAAPAAEEDPASEPTTYDSLTSEQRAAVDAKAPTPTTPVAPLVDAVAEASQEFKGSSEKLKIFNDIASRAKDQGGLDEIKEQIAKGHFKKAYKDLTPTQAKLVNDVAQDEHQRYIEARGGEEAPEQGIDFDHLRGYSSELGRAIDDSYRADGPGDVRRALQRVKERVDAMAQHMANEAQAGGKLKTAKQHWYIFKSAYEEPTGPSGSGSPLAKSVDAGQAFPAGNAFHATEPFLEDDPQLASRARELAVGRRFTDPYYDPNLGKLIDRLRDIKRQQAKLPKPEKTTAAIAARPVEATPPIVEHQPAKLKDLPEPKEPLTPRLKKEPAAPEPTPQVTPETTQATPAEITERNIKTIQNKLKSYRNVSVYRVAEMAAGTVSVVSGIAALVTHAAGMGVAASSLGLASGGAFLFALGPRLLANLLDSEPVIRQLATPTLADYDKVMKMPPGQRAGFESAILQLARAAEKAGKLKKPSPWISFFSKVATGAAAANKPAREQQQQIDKTRSEQLDKDTMSEADKALNESKVKVPIAIHDKTGRKLVHTGHGWVDMQTGEPVNG